MKGVLENSLLSSSNEALAIIKFSIDGKIEWASQGFLELMGYSLDEIIGKHHSIFVPYSFRKTDEYKKFWSSFKNGESYSSEFKRITKDRRDVWLRGSYLVEKNKSGEAIGVVKVAYDITKEKERLLVLEQKTEALDKSTARVEFDTNGNILWANSIFLGLVEYSLDEIQGRHHSLLVPRDEANSLEYSKFWEGLSSGDFRAGEFKRITKSGKEIWIIGSYNPIFSSNGNVETIEKFVIDITEKKALNLAQEGQLKTIHRSGAVVEFDLNGNIIDANRNFLDLMCYGKNEVIGKHHSIFVSDEEFQSDEYKKFWESLRKGKFQSGEFKRFDKYGGEVWIRGAYNPVLNAKGEVEKVLKFVFDVSEVKKMEGKLSEAKSLAEKASASKSIFLANMSHEIRTPLNGVLGCANLLLDNVKEPENVKLLETVVTCGDTLLTLINDILDFSKLESEKMELENEPFNLQASVNQITQLFNSKASVRSVLLASSLDKGVPNWIYGDVTRFRQILSNLVSNAVKFTEKGNIKVRVDLIEEIDENCTIRVSVKDDGIGMDEAGKNKLFKSFSQVETSTTKKFGGTGLGLAICKSLVELMGGEIWVESEKGKGSTFFFTMVAKRAEPGSEEESFSIRKLDKNMAENHPLKMLLVDDNRVNQLVGKKLIEKLGYRIDVAADGLEVLDMIKAKSYDLIFMDCHMPGMDGFETTKVILDKYKENRPKIVALTASAMKEDREKCFSVGMDDFVTKPIDVKEVVKVIKKYSSNEESHCIEGKYPIIREDDLYAQFGGDAEILSEIAGEFSSKTGDYLNNIRKAIESNDSKDLEMTAHTLKGAASNFHADRVVKEALKLEILGREKSWEDVEIIFTVLEASIQELNKELEKICNHRAA